MRPEERVIPQISVPLKTRNTVDVAAPSASRPAGSRPGAINDGAARCLATEASERAACEQRESATSAPVKTAR